MLLRYLRRQPPLNYRQFATKTAKRSSTNTSSHEQYKRLDPISHVLLRPGMYVGSISRTKQQLWLPATSGTPRMVLQEASYIPALYKIFDEIIVNAADNYQRDSNMTSIDVHFDRATDTISVRNDGTGIPVRLHETEQVYVPELVLGNLLTGSNFDDTEGRLTGGKNAVVVAGCSFFVSGPLLCQFCASF